MSEGSEIDVVLTNAPRIEKAFGRNWAVLITLVSLYFARRPPGVLGLTVALFAVVALAIQAWLKLKA